MAVHIQIMTLIRKFQKDVCIRNVTARFWLTFVIVCDCLFCCQRI